MKISIIVSKRDLAGTNIAEILIDKHMFRETNEFFDGYRIYGKNEFELVFGEKDVLYLDYVSREADVYVFASRHKSESGYPCLTVHPTGNFTDDVSHGGRPRELCLTNSLLMKAALIQLKRLVNERNLNYMVSYEVTHHGPTNLDRPLFFVEVGSTKENWMDLNACECVADAIMHLTKPFNVKSESCIGFGGPHYAPTFTKNVLSTEIAVGHICPKYSADNLNHEMIHQMMEKTIPKPTKALIDWKGLKGSQRRFIIEALNELNLEVTKL